MRIQARNGEIGRFFSLSRFLAWVSDTQDGVKFSQNRETAQGTEGGTGAAIE